MFMHFIISLLYLAFDTTTVVINEFLWIVLNTLWRYYSQLIEVNNEDRWQEYTVYTFFTTWQPQSYF